MLIDFVPTENIFFHDFRFSFPRESSFPRQNWQISKYDVNLQQKNNQTKKCWFIGLYRIVSWHQEQKAWPDTLIFWMQSLTHISDSRILPNTNQFLLSLSAIFRTSICFSQMRRFPTQVLSRLLQVRHERMRFTTRWWVAFWVKSFKAAVINLQVRGTLLIRIQNGCQSAYNP